MPALRRVFVHEGAGLEPVSIDGFPDMPVFGGDTWEDWEISRDLGELGAQYEGDTVLKQSLGLFGLVQRKPIMDDLVFEMEGHSDAVRAPLPRARSPKLQPCTHVAREGALSRSGSLFADKEGGPASKSMGLDAENRDARLPAGWISCSSEGSGVRDRVELVGRSDLFRPAMVARPDYPNDGAPDRIAPASRSNSGAGRISSHRCRVAPVDEPPRMNTAQLPERVPSTGRVLISPRTQRNQAESGSTRGCNASLPELSLLVRPPPVGSPPLQPLTSHPTKDNWGSGRADHRSVPTRKPAASTQSRPTTRLTNRSVFDRRDIQSKNSLRIKCPDISTATDAPRKSLVRTLFSCVLRQHSPNEEPHKARLTVQAVDDLPTSKAATDSGTHAALAFRELRV